MTKYPGLDGDPMQPLYENEFEFWNSVLAEQEYLQSIEDHKTHRRRPRYKRIFAAFMNWLSRVVANRRPHRVMAKDRWYER